MNNKQDLALNSSRYRIYREHKYICSVLYKLLQQVATLDFNSRESLKGLNDEFKCFEELLQNHAEYEETRIHSILKRHNVDVFHDTEQQHQEHKLFFADLGKQISNIENERSSQQINFAGYEIYLTLRKFASDMLEHFDYEETIIMPTLQQLVSDQEIQEIDRQSYRIMSPEQMAHMVELLFPHMNADDRFTFISEIKASAPQNFANAWDKISACLKAQERDKLIQVFKMSNDKIILTTESQNA